MGWKLAEEVAWARPDRPGPEWWTLMDLAQSARDETRQSLPGIEYLTGRGKCTKRTIYRRLEALRDQKLIRITNSSGPGTRAIYEISDELIPWPSGDSVSDTCSGDSVSDTCSGDSVSDTCSGDSVSDTCSSGDSAEQVTETARTGDSFGETGDSVSGTPLVTYSSTLPSEIPVAVVPPSVEVGQLDADSGAARQPIEQQAWLALHSRM